MNDNMIINSIISSENLADILHEKIDHFEKYIQEGDQIFSTSSRKAILKYYCAIFYFINIVYVKIGLPEKAENDIFDKIHNNVFEETVPNNILMFLDFIRIISTKIEFNQELSSDEFNFAHISQYFLKKWLLETFLDFQGLYPQYTFIQPQNEKEVLSQSDLQELHDEKIKFLNYSNDKISENITDDIRNLMFENSKNFKDIIDIIQEKIGIKDIFLGYKLTDDQQHLVDMLDGFLRSNANTFILHGKAGTGKTFIMRGLVEYLKATKKAYILAASTGKAAKVISEKARSAAYTIQKTIYSCKEFRSYEDDITNSDTYKFYFTLNNYLSKEKTIFIFDEASMISDIYNENEFIRWGSGRLLQDIFTYVNLDNNDHSKKIIFIGDKMQLPPVQMNHSPALDSNYLKNHYFTEIQEFELSQIVRQKQDSGIISNADILRKSIRENKFNKLIFNYSSEDIQEVHSYEMIERFVNEYRESGSDNCILIAYSNAEILRYNYEIRQVLSGIESHDIRNGDKIIANKNILNSGILICNGDFGEIVDILGQPIERNIEIRQLNQETHIVERKKVLLTFRNVIVNFKSIKGEDQIFKTYILENLLHSSTHSLSSDENKALFIDFCIRHPTLRKNSEDFKNTLLSDPFFNCLQVKFGYAITCHKSQGSEWKKVFIQCKNSMQQLSKAYFRWLYTAMTRASETVFLIDPPHLQIGSKMKFIGF